MAVKKILYAEDNPDDVVILKFAFKRAGVLHSLHSVEDGEAAIAWMNGEGDYAQRDKHPLPDLVILDLKMPKKSGFDVLEWLKNSKDFANLPVIILSSSDDPRDIDRVSKLGATKHFMKSASCLDIVQYLQSLG